MTEKLTLVIILMFHLLFHHLLNKEHHFFKIISTVFKNPISIIIPCHRVIGTDGKLVGYSGGLLNKKALLQLEGALLSRGQMSLL